MIHHQPSIFTNIHPILIVVWLPVHNEAFLYEVPPTITLVAIQENCLQRRTYKGKAIPLQAWTVPEGSKRLRLPDLKTIST